LVLVQLSLCVFVPFKGKVAYVLPSISDLLVYFDHNSFALIVRFGFEVLMRKKEEFVKFFNLNCTSACRKTIYTLGIPINAFCGGNCLWTDYRAF
jgi:hypothetical protein